jgi:signal transduction histidine kinase
MILALALGILVVATGFGAYLAWRSAQSVLTMVEAMDKYSQNPGQSRMTTELPQEFQKMANSFNKMLDGVEDHQVALIRQESILRVGQLASILAHEVRHGLHVMLNIIFMIDSVSNETKNSVNRLVHDLVAKISDIMEFSRAGNISPEPVTADYITFQAGESVRYSKIAQGRTIKVSHRKGVPSPEVFADRTKSVAALANMVRNSVESGAQEINISWHMIRDNVIDFRVVDNGPGIPADSMSSLFEPFHSSRRKGFGIGLSMADMVATAHGGRVYLVDSGPTGVEMRMMLPMNGTPIEKDDLPPRIPPHLDVKAKAKQERNEELKKR